MRSIHIRAVDRARHCGLGGPQALVAVAEVPRCHEVSIAVEAAAHTPEPGLPPPVGRIDVAAGGAAAAGVAGIHRGHHHPVQGRLVGQQVAQPPEAPRVEPPPAVAVTCRRPVPDVREGLEDQRVAWLHRRAQPLREDVVTVAAETCQPAAEAAEMARGRRGRLLGGRVERKAHGSLDERHTEIVHQRARLLPGLLAGVSAAREAL